MLKQKDPPKVFHDDNSVFADFSDEALDYARDTFALELSSTQDFLYFGFKKPVNRVYIEMGTVNTNANTLDVEIFDGTNFVDVTDLIDETKGFTRSAFLRFDRIRDSRNWQSTTINLVDKFWFRIRPSSDFSAGTTVQGMNIVFSDDQDLKAEYPEILDFISTNETSYILRHQAARDHIIQDLRNAGQYKLRITDAVTGDTEDFIRLENIDPWDLLESSEVNRWSTYYTLSRIFSNLHSAPDDLWAEKRDEYASLAKTARDMFWVTLDIDDDGIEDSNEKQRFKTAIMIRR